MARSSIVLAPGCSGKSYLAWRHPRVARDGDEIIKHSTGWPLGEWWKSPDAASIHRRNEGTIRAWAAKNDGMIVLFNGQFATPPDAVWMPSDDELLLNADRKRIERERTGRNRLQPTDPAIVLDAARRMRSEVQGVPVLSTSQLFAAVSVLESI